MDKDKANVPKIRFPGFTDPWEQCKLGDITECYSGGTPSVRNKTYYGGTIPFIRSGEINAYSTELFLTEEGLQNSSAKEVKKGDILYALYGATSGEVGISHMNGAINQAILAIKPSPKYNCYFIAQWLRKQRNLIVNTYLQGGQGNLSGNIVKDLVISIPENEEEQSKIGTFFKDLDNLITLHQRKLNHLQDKKKSLLQKMFPKNGEDFPELRFPGFTDPWEQRKFEDFTKLSQGLQIAISKRYTENIDGSKYFYITNEFLNPKSDKKYYIKNPLKNVVATKDDILMTRTGNTGKIVTNVSGAYHNNFFKIDFNHSKYDKMFLYYLLNIVCIQKEILSRAGTSTIPDLNHSEFYTIKVVLPSYEEQKKIGEFFKQFDDFIILHQRKLNHLQEQKKALLQQMFV
ncbi:restriction endonuclease subunit S [Clostridium kluyveri]|uniref:Type I restriction modification DNA specificity domain-containing protein n=1 Tax=Clostridium kluyveri TaxID=1534 RepID=A0A1L5FDL6_CLOKL|nr:restriction endonuclease subunit S [Clostridium kluyveri]APM40900.1 hypothetical protein BS101_20410 [Clostridium kluyveri]